MPCCTGGRFRKRHDFYVRTKAVVKPGLLTVCFIPQHVEKLFMVAPNRCNNGAPREDNYDHEYIDVHV